MKDYRVMVAQSQGGRSWKPGDTRRLSEAEARALVMAGLVEPIKAAPAKRSRRKKAAK